MKKKIIHPKEFNRDFFNYVQLALCLFLFYSGNDEIALIFLRSFFPCKEMLYFCVYDVVDIATTFLSRVDAIYQPTRFNLKKEIKNDR